MIQALLRLLYLLTHLRSLPGSSSLISCDLELPEAYLLHQYQYLPLEPNQAIYAFLSLSLLHVPHPA
ncbi:hypothetical protein F5879DRAFT_996866 [Lentinula edodes]|nr:hypothetical protein F5879DRAFT_996866 [Lentinula edodes]